MTSSRPIARRQRATRSVPASAAARRSVPARSPRRKTAPRRRIHLRAGLAHPHGRQAHRTRGTDSPGSTWSDFRGPNRDGRYTATPIRTTWPREGLRRLWKQPVGAGYASFVVADGRAFTIEQRRNQEVVAAYDVQTGREIWTNAWNASFEESMGGDGPRATPTYHEGRIYALGAEGELRVLDAAKGTLVWRRNILSDNGADNLSWGMSAAPLIVDDTVVVLPGRHARQLGRRVQKGDGRSGVEGAERRSVLHLADARDARRRPAAARRHGHARRRAHARQGHAAVGVPVEHIQRHQRGAADRLYAQRARSHFHVGLVRTWRRGVRARRVQAIAFRRKRSGKTSG